jgi:hypothetical protein
MPGYDVMFGLTGLLSAGVAVVVGGAGLVYLVGRSLQRSEAKARQKRWQTPSS